MDISEEIIASNSRFGPYGDTIRERIRCSSRKLPLKEKFRASLRKWRLGWPADIRRDTQLINTPFVWFAPGSAIQMLTFNDTAHWQFDKNAAALSSPLETARCPEARRAEIVAVECGEYLLGDQLKTSPFRGHITRKRF